MENRSSSFIGSVPEHYDRSLGPVLFQDYADDLARRSLSINPTDVLELAAGTGIVTEALRNTLADSVRITATDLNEPMLQLAGNKVEPESVRFETADAMNLPYADNSFDLLLCQFGVMFFPDKEASFREAIRVLRPGGRYLLNVWCSWDDNPFARMVHEEVARHFSDNPPLFYQVPFSFHDTDVASRTMKSAGFSSVDVETVKLSKELSSVTDFARGLVLGNPMAQELADRGVEAENMVEVIADALERNLGTKPCRVDLQAHVLLAEAP